MTKSFGSGPDKQAGPLLASSLVVFLGGIGGAIIVAAGGGDPTGALIIFGVSIGLLLALMLLGRAMPSSRLSDLYGWVLSRDAKPKMDYVPRPNHPSRRNYGTNKPPTLEEVREMKDSPNCWVPGNSPSSRRRKSS